MRGRTSTLLCVHVGKGRVAVEKLCVQMGKLCVQMGKLCAHF